MQRREDDVTGFCRLQACRHRLEPAQFTDEEYVRIGSQRPAHAFGERGDVTTDFVLRDHGFQPSMLVFDRVDGMFEISMLDLRVEPGSSESCDLSSSITSSINALAPVATGRGTNVTHLPCAPFEVAIGADRLMQILLNVVENAIKHGRDRGRVYVSVAPLDARYVEVRVDDDGPGVPLDEREIVFTLARRGTSARSRGTGLGLAVVRLMLERIGGEVDVTSSLMGGAQFRVRLPLMSAPNDEAAASPSFAVGDRDGEPVSLGDGLSR